MMCANNCSLRAARLLEMLSPVRHSSTREQADRYRVDCPEPGAKFEV